jgi:hypothetical protein
VSLPTIGPKRSARTFGSRGQGIHDHVRAMAAKGRDWRTRPPRGWWLRGRFRRLTIWNVVNIALAVLIGVVAGIWWFAIAVCGIWALFLVLAFGLWAARRFDHLVARRGRSE